MSVRAIAIRNRPRPLLVHRPVRTRHPRPATLWARFADDRRFIGLKIVLLGLLLLAAMALEVPL